MILRARIGASIERKRLHDNEKLHLQTIEAQANLLADANAALKSLAADLEDRVVARTAELAEKSEELRATTQQLWQTAKLVTMGGSPRASRTC
ncbi:MAG TPA: hypothetical protein VFC51_17770 [Chloroflexota bacterium]|nr:hypothetical protein [Chloroflexota bacterium]